MKNWKVEIDNFRSINTADYEFNQGINLISGKNYRGKSSTFHALLLLRYNKCDFNLADCVNWNTDKDYFELKESFEHVGLKFSQSYTYKLNKKGKGTASRELIIIDKDGKENTYKNSEAVDVLSTYFDPALDLASSVIKQKDKENIVETKPAERRELFKKIHDLNFKQAIQEIESEIKQSKSEFESISKEHYLLENKEYNYMETCVLPFNESDYSLFEKELRSKQVLLAEDEKNIRELQSNKQEIASLELQKNELSRKSEQLEIDAKRYEIETLNISESLNKNLYEIADNLKAEFSSIILTRNPNLEKLESERKAYIELFPQSN